jgi:hypothetical protein
MASLACAGLALYFRRQALGAGALMAVGAVLATPSSLYISVLLGIPIAGPISACLYLGGAGALMLKRPRIALLLLVPFLAIAGFGAFLVLSDSDCC